MTKQNHIHRTGKMVRGIILRRFDNVLIYNDPVTREQPEGTAMLKKFISRDEESNLERWQVVFISDNFTCERSILAAQDPMPKGDLQTAL